MNRNKDSMTPKRWAHIKQLRAHVRYIHISAYARMIRNPVDPNGVAVPWIERPGVTLVLHRKARNRNETNTARTA